MPRSWLRTELQADISAWPLKPTINHTSCPAGTTQECINSAIEMAQHHYTKNKICGRALLWLRGSEKNLSKYLRHLPCVKSHDCSSNSSVDTSASLSPSPPANACASYQQCVTQGLFSSTVILLIQYLKSLSSISRHPKSLP